MATLESVPVRFYQEALTAYLPALRERKTKPGLDSELLPSIRSVDRSAFVLIRDCINFGSGFHPYLKKRSGMSGSRTIAWNLAAYFLANGAPRPNALLDLGAADCARMFDQPAHGPAFELMKMFASALNEFGRYVCERFEGEYERLIEHAGDSAIRFVGDLVEMRYWNDRVTCAGLEFPFFKRAQLAAYGISIVRPRAFSDLDALTVFADNLIPHVLKIDGVLEFCDSLDEQIGREAPLNAGSLDEVSIRAMTVLAGDVLVQLSRESGVEITALEVAAFLWKRGQTERYKSVPRHRTRTYAY